MGGSMTETTHAATRYTPKIRASCSHSGHPSPSSPLLNVSCRRNSAPASREEGRLAPLMVSQKINASSPSMMG